MANTHDLYPVVMHPSRLDYKGPFWGDLTQLDGEFYIRGVDDGLLGSLFL